MSSFFNVLFEFLLELLKFFLETFLFISVWIPRFIKIAFETTQFYEIILISIIVGVILFVLLKLGFGTAKIVIIILFVILALVLLLAIL